MTAADVTADWRSAVSAQDLTVATFSDDEYDALWAPERLELDPEAGPRLAAGVRGLLAHDYAVLQPDGSIELSGEAALVRKTRTANLGTVLLRLPGEDRQWLLVRPGVVLEQRRPTPAGFSFVLRDLKRAVRELVEEVVPVGTTEGEEWSFGPDDPREQWVELEAQNPQVTSFDVLRPVLDQEAWVAQRMTLLTDGTQAGWCAFTGYDLRTTVRPATPASVRRLLLGLLEGQGLTLPEQNLA
jgi:hypothetical protein